MVTTCNDSLETTPLEDTGVFGQPSWNEQFDFYLDSMDYPLELKIIERDKFGDHFVGMYVS